MMEELRACDLFCGCGGFRLAMEQLGIRTVFSSEIDQNAIATYAANFGDSPAGDVTKIDPETVPDFDILTAGFPCQSFSIAGKRLGLSDPTKGTLFYDVLRFIRAKRPVAALLENVPNIAHIDGGKTLATILQALNDAGYHATWAVLNSHPFGVPQNRYRWYCVALRDFALFDFPAGTAPRTVMRDIIEETPTEPIRSLEPRCLQLVRYHFAHTREMGVKVMHPASGFAEGTKVGEHGMQGKLLKNDILEFRKLWCDQSAQAYTCMSVNSVAPTIIRTHAPKFWDLERLVTSREAARMQGFPDDFVLPCSHRANLHLMGNSVSVPTVRAILAAIVATINQQRKAA